jgi:hypothetical protein
MTRRYEVKSRYLRRDDPVQYRIGDFQVIKMAGQKFWACYNETPIEHCPTLHQARALVNRLWRQELLKPIN